MTSGPFTQRALLSGLLAMIAVLTVGGAAALVLGLVLDKHQEVRSGIMPAHTERSVAPGRSFRETAAQVHPSEVGNAKFLSLTLPEEGRPKSYMLAASDPLFRPLTQAVTQAQAEGTTSGAGGPETLTFVLVGRRTVTFQLDLAGGTIVCRGKARRPARDLSELADKATMR